MACYHISTATCSECVNTTPYISTGQTTPFMVENITIDQRYVFEKRIRELEAALRAVLSLYLNNSDITPIKSEIEALLNYE